MFSFRADPPPRGGVGVAFTDRYGGVSAEDIGPLNLGRVGVDDLDHVRENFARVRTALGVAAIATVDQRHTADVRVVGTEDWEWGPEQHLGSGVPGQVANPIADALVSTEPGIALCIRVADCLPVLFADPVAGVIGAAHAGRVGLAAGVLTRTVRVLRAHGATRLTAWLGPHVCGRCYEVGADMADEIGANLPGSRATTDWGTPSLDLAAGAVRQLTDLGCRVQRHDRCTRTSAGLHSHRRDGARSGRLAGLVWLQPGAPPEGSPTLT